MLVQASAWRCSVSLREVAFPGTFLLPSLSFSATTECDHSGQSSRSSDRLIGLAPSRPVRRPTPSCQLGGVPMSRSGGHRDRRRVWIGRTTMTSSWGSVPFGEVSADDRSRWIASPAPPVPGVSHSLNVPKKRPYLVTLFRVTSAHRIQVFRAFFRPVRRALSREPLLSCRSATPSDGVQKEPPTFQRTRLWKR